MKGSPGSRRSWNDRPCAEGAGPGSSFSVSCWRHACRRRLRLPTADRESRSCWCTGYGIPRPRTTAWPPESLPRDGRSTPCPCTRTTAPFPWSSPRPNSGRFIEEKLGTQEPFDLVGFSMGGIIARYYAQRMDGLDRILRLILISTPNHGTRTAFLESLSGVMELRPGSPLLADLAADEERLDSIPFTSIWSPLDLAIEPPSSSHMPFGREIVLPVLSHAWMLSDDRTIQAVIEALELPR